MLESLIEYVLEVRVALARLSRSRTMSVAGAAPHSSVKASGPPFAMRSSTLAESAPSQMRLLADLEPLAVPEYLFGLPPSATMIAARIELLPVPFRPTMKFSRGPKVISKWRWLLKLTRRTDSSVPFSTSRRRGQSETRPAATGRWCSPITSVSCEVPEAAASGAAAEERLAFLALGGTVACCDASAVSARSSSSSSSTSSTAYAGRRRRE